MANAAEADIVIDNRLSSYITWPLIWIELTSNMNAIDEGNPPTIYRVESPNFDRKIYLAAPIELDPEPTALAPVKVFIDTKNRQMYVDPESAHAQAGELLHFMAGDSRFFYLLPRRINWIFFENFDEDFTVGVRWRRGYV